MSRRDLPRSSRAGRAPAINKSLDYQIEFYANEKYSQFGPARFISKQLDKRMHVGQEVAFIYKDIGTCYGPDQSPPRITLDSFEIHSLEDYLGRQSHFRQLIEKAVDDRLDRYGGNRRGIRRGAAMWRSVKVASILLDTDARNDITRRQFELRAKLFGPKPTKAEIDKMFANRPKPSKRSWLQVFLQAPWQDEHEHSVIFSDGQFREFVYG